VCLYLGNREYLLELVVLDRLEWVEVVTVVVLEIVRQDPGKRCSVVDLEEVVMFEGLQSMDLLIVESRRKRYREHLDAADYFLANHIPKWQALVD
jgi:hypothetical protein